MMENRRAEKCPPVRRFFFAKSCKNKYGKYRKLLVVNDLQSSGRSVIIRTLDEGMPGCLRESFINLVH